MAPDPIRVARVLSSEDARATLIGTRAPVLEANVNDAGLYVDADTGAPVLYYCPLPVALVPGLRSAVRTIKMGTTRRGGTGIVNVSRTFGMAPRLVLKRREGCVATSMAYEHPGPHSVLVDLSVTLTSLLGEVLPDVVAADRAYVEQVLPDWRMDDDSLWTSGVVNLSSPLPYHLDRANFPTWSAQPNIRRGVRGGYLNIPEYDLTVACRDGWVVYFLGQALVHGVTPLTARTADAYRFSVVYYALSGLKDCHTTAVEQARARSARSLREENMANESGGDLTDADLTRGAPDEVADLVAGLDFRRPEFRREVFHRFYEWTLRHRSHPGAVYYLFPALRAHFGWDDEAALWFAFLNGNTQNPLTSLILHRRFPDVACAGELAEWFDAHRPLLAFDTDRRYHKKALPAAVGSYLDAIAPFGSQAAWADAAAEGGWPGVWRACSALHTFGRLSAFSYAEYLRIMGHGVDCSDLMLGDLGGSRSHRNGLAIVLGRDDLDWHKSNPTFAGYGPDIYAWMTDEATLLLAEAHERAAGQPWAGDVGYLTLESALCTYKSWHRPNRRYPGVYNDLGYLRILEAQERFPDDDFAPVWAARAAALPPWMRLEDRPADPGAVPAKQNHYRLTGQVIGMSHEWPAFVNDFDAAIDSGKLPPCR